MTTPSPDYSPAEPLLEMHSNSSATSRQDLLGEAFPEGAISLVDLVQQTGPLPPDAALECVDRIASHLLNDSSFCRSCWTAEDVLLDDDGEIWFRPRLDDASRIAEYAVGAQVDQLEPLGRVLWFLVTGSQETDALRATVHDCESPHGVDSAAVQPADSVQNSPLPSHLVQVAGRLVSRNGARYSSLEAAQRDIAAARDLSTVDLACEETAALASEQTPLACDLPAVAASAPDAEADPASKSFESPDFGAEAPIDSGHEPMVMVSGEVNANEDRAYSETESLARCVYDRSDSGAADAITSAFSSSEAEGDTLSAERRADSPTDAEPQPAASAPWALIALGSLAAAAAAGGWWFFAG